MLVTARLEKGERKHTGLRVDTVATDGTFSGYASLFREVDLGRDMVEPGAFAASLARRGAGGVRMLFQHDPAQPIGVWEELREDGRGLFARGRIATGSAKGREVMALMREGALDGLSIGFKTVRAKADSRTGVRRILEADLWEISVVTFPMLPGARVGSVKRALPTTRQLERWLRRDAGFSRGEARAVIARGFAEMKRERDAARATLDGLVRTIRAAAGTLNDKDE